MYKAAEISHCKRYRYALWRLWDETKPYVMFVGLNPSTADAILDDPTLIRCMKFSESWGYGGVVMTNLFAYRATQPNDMKNAIQPVGSENNDWLQKIAKDAGIIIAAWGNDGTHLQRSAEVRQLLPTLHCLKINQSGEPAHPLYQKATTSPIPYPAPAP